MRPKKTREASPAARTARRAWRIVRRLEEGPLRRSRALTALVSVLRRRGPARDSLLAGPALAAWLAAAEETLELLHPASSDRMLFDRISEGRHLALLVPHGRLDAGFRSRVRTLALRQRASLMRRLVPLLMFRLPPGVTLSGAELDLLEDGEEARRPGELHVEHPEPATARLPAGARVRLDGPRVRLASGATIAWRPRPRLAGSGIVLARSIVSTPGGLRVPLRARERRGVRRLSAALGLLQRAWPEAREAVELHTRVIVPLTEANTVSFSMPSRPGVSYINLEGKSLVDLADDLLHETAHHMLHAIEESGALVRDDGEPRYVSPWRRSLRPVRGILHATWTFGFRSELLDRLLRLPPERGLRRRWLRAQRDRERKALARGRAQLRDALAKGLLTRRGAAVLRLGTRFPA